LLVVVVLPLPITLRSAPTPAWHWVAGEWTGENRGHDNGERDIL
jgi:hypothetical protein